MRRIAVLLVLCSLFACSPQNEPKSRVTDVVALQAADLATPMPIEPLEIPSTTPVPASQVTSSLNAIREYLGRTDLEGENLGQTRSLNSPGLEVDRYRIDGVEFEVDVESGQIVWIDTANSVLPKEMGSEYSQEDLQQRAHQLTVQLAPDVNVDSYTLTVGRKGDNFFFRWQDSRGFLQIGYDAYGNLLNFCNATGL